MEDVLEALAQGRISVEEARERLAGSGLSTVDEWALLDVERQARTGLPEVVLAEGKSPQALAAIVQRFLEEQGHVLVSRLDGSLLRESGLDALDAVLDYDDEARFARFTRPDHEEGPVHGRVAVITAGTADRAVAREAMCTLKALQAEVRWWTDRGVAAPRRLAPTLREVLQWEPDAVIVAAGREGTLATLVAALVPMPVVGLPVSVGYGHAGRGEAALSSMLQSCSPLAVVNIDAGVTAGLVAARIAARAQIRGKRLESPEEAESASIRLRGRQY